VFAENAVQAMAKIQLCLGRSLFFTQRFHGRAAIFHSDFVDIAMRALVAIYRRLVKEI